MNTPEKASEGLISLAQQQKNRFYQPREFHTIKNVGKFASTVAGFWLDRASDVYTLAQKSPQEAIQKPDWTGFYGISGPSGDVRKVGPKKAKLARKQHKEKVAKIITPAPEVWQQNSEPAQKPAIYDWALELDMDEALPENNFMDDVTQKVQTSETDTLNRDSFCQGFTPEDLSQVDRQAIGI